MRISVTGNENSSLGQAFFKSRKSTQMRICPFFFFTGTMLATQSGFYSSCIKPASMSFLVSMTTFSSSSILMRRGACLTGCTFGSILSLWTAGLNRAFLRSSMRNSQHISRGELACGKGRFLLRSIRVCISLSKSKASSIGTLA
jgi:hypothetical protein